MTWLVTGGAGYIGAHVVRRLVEAGLETVVLDDLSSGRTEFVPEGIDFVQCSILDTEAVRAALTRHGVDGVVHLAAFKYAGLSVEEPLSFYRNNVDGTRSLLEAMGDVGVERLVFSSSCSVYGTPDTDHVTEETPTRPESPYGETKLICEWLIRDVARARPLRFTMLRYFNIAGSGYADVRDENPYGLLPAVMRCLSEGRPPIVNGDDYPTRDGTCERDYLHVSDLADAHVRAVQLMTKDLPLGPVYNLGTGTGATVLEMLGMVKAVSGVEFEPDVRGRRPGDPARIVASPELARDALGWVAEIGHDEMVRSAWHALV